MATNGNVISQFNTIASSLGLERTSSTTPRVVSSWVLKKKHGVVAGVDLFYANDN